jgi:hypothetical protein
MVVRNKFCGRRRRERAIAHFISFFLFVQQEKFCLFLKFFIVISALFRDYLPPIANSFICLVLFTFQVSSWVTHLIVSPPSHDERKAVLSCLIRTAVICWNLGNFHGATEIIVGLR